MRGEARWGRRGRRHKAQDLSRHLLRNSAPLTHPGLRQMTRSMAGLLAHGSPALFRLPAAQTQKMGQNNSGIMEPSLAAYSCGGSQGIGRAFHVEKPVLTLFPLASFGHDQGRTSGTIKQGAL